MTERLLVLAKMTEGHLLAIERLYAALGTPELREDASEEALIVVAFRLHEIYNAFANIFRNVAAGFERTLDGDEHDAELLRDMRLDLSPVRPAVIDRQVFEALEELRRWRELFLSAYGDSLDRARLALAVRQALALRSLYRAQLERFLAFVRSVQ